jgi:hypothetical protein
VRAGEDHGADGGVFVEGFEGGVELEDEGRGEGIEGFGVVEFNCNGFECRLWWMVGEKSCLLIPTPGLGVEILRYL